MSVSSLLNLTSGGIYVPLYAISIAVSPTGHCFDPIIWGSNSRFWLSYLWWDFPNSARSKHASTKAAHMNSWESTSKHGYRYRNEDLSQTHLPIILRILRLLGCTGRNVQVMLDCYWKDPPKMEGNPGQPDWGIVTSKCTIWQHHSFEMKAFTMSMVQLVFTET